MGSTHPSGRQDTPPQPVASMNSLTFVFLTLSILFLGTQATWDDDGCFSICRALANKNFLGAAIKQEDREGCKRKCNDLIVGQTECKDEKYEELGSELCSQLGSKLDTCTLQATGMFHEMCRHT